MFDVELTLFEEDDSFGPVAIKESKANVLVLRRDYQEFRALHHALGNVGTSGKKRELLLPPLPMYKEGMTDADMAEDLAAYVHVLLANPEVTSSQPFLSFLKDSESLVGNAVGGGVQAGPIPENAVDFLLQPCSYLPLYIPRRMKHTQDLEVPKGSTVLWRFIVADGLDVVFSVHFTPSGDSSTPGQAQEAIRASKCPLMGKDPVCQGMYKALTTSGVCTFTWDNTYSRLRGKQVQYILQVVDEETMGAAVEAADELSKATNRHKSVLTARLQAGEALDGKVGVSITPVARPAMDADSFFNPLDLTVDPNFTVRTSSVSDGDRQRSASLDNSDGRRSSLGSIWDYITTRPGWPIHERVGDEADGELSKVVGMIEKLEDDLAGMTAKKEQAEAELIIALAKQRRWSIEKDRFERKMQEAMVKADAAQEQVKALEQEKATLMSTLNAKEKETEMAQEEAKRAQRAMDVMLAEKHVWSVAHSGAQEELSKMSTSLEKEKQAHEDTRETLKKAREAAHKFKAEMESLRSRLEQKVDEKAFQSTQEELTVARAEVQDSRDAIAEAEAENDNLKGQIRVLVQHVKQQKHELAGLQGEVNQLRMHTVAQDKKIIQLRAEKKLLVAELKQHRARTSSISSMDGERQTPSPAPPLSQEAPPPARTSSVEMLSSTSTSPMATTSTDPDQSAASSSPVVATSSPTSPPPPPPPPPSHQSPSSTPTGAQRHGLERDPRYLRLMTQLENCTERRQQLLALLEENPKNASAQALIADLEAVLAMLRKKLRALLAEAAQQQPPPGGGGGDRAS